MFVELPQNLILMTVGAFLLGWMISSINARMGSGQRRANKRDPKDDRIRQLDAELRITQTERGKAEEKLEEIEKELETATEEVKKRDSVISHQQRRVEEMKKDLKDSVMKTRELRNELSDRAAENVKSEAKLREVETELSVAQASTDLIATGVLDYSMTPDGEAAIDEDSESPDFSKTAT